MSKQEKDATENLALVVWTVKLFYKMKQDLYLLYFNMYLNNCFMIVELDSSHLVKALISLSNPILNGDIPCQVPILDEMHDHRTHTLGSPLQNYSMHSKES